MNQQAERRVGTIIGGKWRVDALLGSGSMAAVYGVTHRNGARAALKILHPTLCTDPAVCERFLGEGYLANSVKHSGIVRVLDDGVTDDGCVFLTMDLLEGDTLEALRQKRGNKIPIAEALEIGDKLMDVLSAVHAAGIIHRDLKPQNVFVCDDSVLKLLDFGVARVFDRTSQSKLSMFGLVLGTPSFMSPEQALGSRDKVDHRSDIWSLGATLFTALTGETVHLGANVQAKLLAAATVKARSIAMVMPTLPPGISAAIDMALRFKKEDRWQSVDAMRRAFREARGGNVAIARPESPVRAFDMPGNESVERHRPESFAGAGPTSSSSKRTPPLSEPPPEGPGGTFIGMGDGSIPPPARGTRSSAPPLPHRVRSEGGSAAPQSSQPSPQPSSQARAPARGTGTAVISSAPPPSNGVAKPHAHKPFNMPAPEAIVRRPRTPDPAGIAIVPVRSSRPDAQDGSIPPYGALNFGADDSVSDIDPRALGMRPRGTLGVWVMAVLLAAAAIGGVSFFMVKRGPVAPAGNPEEPGTSVTASPSATVPMPGYGPGASPVLPQPTSMAPANLGSASDAALPGSASAAAVPDRAGGSFPWRPGGSTGSTAGGGHAPRNLRSTPATVPMTTTTNDPPVTTSEPPKPPPPPADPFGTPE